jgi:PAS domain S-box-containing protein
MREGIIEQDARGVITGWSDEAAALYGWTREEAIGMRSHLLVPERNRQRHDDALERLRRGRQRQRNGGDRQDLRDPHHPGDRRDRVRPEREEITALHRDGHEFRADVSLSVQGEGEALRVVAAVRPATPETRADAAFRQNERFKSILDQIDDGCAVVDLRGNVLFVNDAFCRMFGFEKPRILGRSFKELQHPDRHAQTLDIFSTVYRTGRPVRSYEYQVTPSSLFVEQSISLERDASGRPVAFLSIFRDCTARKQAEDAAARAREAAESANRAKSEFLANMSHEIRTPMNGIIGMTALALDGPLAPAQAECLEMIRSQAGSLLTIVNDILDFSKIESRRVELESLPFTLAHAVDEVVKPLAVRAREKGISLGSTIAASVPARIVGDPVRLKQILINVIGNAVKFTEAGSVALDISVEQGEDQPQTLHLRVVDTGIGIPPDKVTAIFEPFRQVDGSMTRRFGGTGLGLAIASTLAELMGGGIKVDSAPGRGSTFDITIPAVAAPASVRTESAVSAEIATAARRAAAPARLARILVAEDNIVNQRVAAALLTKRGHSVTVVNNGREAVDALKREGFDLVLMDVQMPEMDGFEATAAIREMERDTGRRVRIVAMTAHAMSGDRERCLAAGMDGYLSKPIDQRSLFDVIEK